MNCFRHFKKLWQILTHESIRLVNNPHFFANNIFYQSFNAWICKVHSTKCWTFLPFSYFFFYCWKHFIHFNLIQIMWNQNWMWWNSDIMWHFSVTTSVYNQLHYCWMLNRMTNKMEKGWDHVYKWMNNFKINTEVNIWGLFAFRISLI